MQGQQKSWKPTGTVRGFLIELAADVDPSGQGLRPGCIEIGGVVRVGFALWGGVVRCDCIGVIPLAQGCGQVAVGAVLRLHCGLQVALGAGEETLYCLGSPLA